MEENIGTNASGGRKPRTQGRTIKKDGRSVGEALQ